jgi:hypothetical protein
VAKAHAGSDEGTSPKKKATPGGRATPHAGSDEGTSPKKKPARAGRATPPKETRELNKRYTAPIPKSVRHSPRWYGPLLLVLLVAGLLLIVGNYVGIMPGGTSNWYLIGGLVGIVAGAMMATQYH